MKKIITFFALIASLYADIIINNPHSLIKVKISKKSVNRIVLPTKILDVAYSKEKGLIIKIVNNQAFLKYQVVKNKNSNRLREMQILILLNPLEKQRLNIKQSLRKFILLLKIKHILLYFIL